MKVLKSQTQLDSDYEEFSHSTEMSFLKDERGVKLTVKAKLKTNDEEGDFEETFTGESVEEAYEKFIERLGDLEEEDTESED